jgi:hypothetical protein
MRTLFTGAPIHGVAGKSLLGLIIEDGKIVSVNANDPHDLRVDLAPNHFVIPAFGDGHAHPLFAGREAQGPRVSGIFSIDQVLATVKNFADQNPDVPWIVGGAYEASLVVGGLFSATLLDTVVSDRPVILHASDHHTIWVNTRALELAGITAQTVDPIGGVIARNSDGSAQGTLREPAAMGLVLNAMPARTMEQEIAAIDWATRKMLNAGITYSTDSWIEPAMIDAYLAAGKADAVHIDLDLAFLITPGNWQNQVTQLASQQALFNQPGLTATSVKFLADGALSAGTALCLQPYLDNKDSYGVKIWPEADLFAAVAACNELGFQIHIHAIGDGAVRQALDAFEAASVTNRPVMVHAQLIDPADLPRIKALGVICNMQPLWMYLDPMNKELIEPRIGTDRNNRQYPLRTIMESGAAVAFGSDWPITSHIPLQALAVPVHRQAAPGATVWSGQESITLAQSLAAYTEGVAFQCGRENELGTLEVGKRADFLVLSANPFAVDIHEVADLKIVAIYKNGQLVS